MRPPQPPVSRRATPKPPNVEYPAQTRSPVRRLMLLAGLALWGIALSVGALQLTVYETTPGLTGDVATHWPASVPFGPSEHRRALVVFLHPHCPCSRATIEELDRLLVRNRAQVDVFAVFVRPTDKAPGWVQTRQWRSVSELPDVRVICDEGGRIRALFGASLSGETLLYGSEGRLAFHGGITGSRGHAGDNPGSDALAARIDDPKLGFCATRAFGCALID